MQRKSTITLLAAGLIGCQPASAGPAIRYYGADTGMPFSQAVEVNGILYISGQVGVAPGAAALVPGGIEPETRQAMENVQAILAANRIGFDQVFKCTVMLADMADWGKFNAVYRSYFKPGRLPARSAFGSTGLAYGGRLELECWARVD